MHVIAESDSSYEWSSEFIQRYAPDTMTIKARKPIPVTCFTGFLVRLNAIRLQFQPKLTSFNCSCCAMTAESFSGSCE